MTINPDGRWDRQQNEGVTPSGPGLRPFGAEPQDASQAKPLVPNAGPIGPSAADLLTLAQDIIREGDHMSVDSSYDVCWLVAQLVAWPTRVHPERTTNDRFIRLSAAKAILAFSGRMEWWRARASAIEAATAAGTAQTGPAEGESAAPAGGDAQHQTPTP